MLIFCRYNSDYSDLQMSLKCADFIDFQMSMLTVRIGWPNVAQSIDLLRRKTLQWKMATYLTVF